METDSSLAALALAVSLASFLLVSLGEASVTALRRNRFRPVANGDEHGPTIIDGLVLSPGVVGGLSLLKLLAMFASILSCAALVFAALDTRWAWVSVVSLGLLVVLGALQVLASRLVAAMGHRTALRVVRILNGVTPLLGPVLSAQNRLSGGRGGERGSPHEIASTELSIPIESGGEPLDAREVRMIRGVVQQDKTIAREIMVPRVDMVAAEVGTSVSEVGERMVDAGHSRFPVYKQSLDQIEGIAYARDILRLLSSNPEASGTPIADVMRPALFIPESKTLEELLSEFQESRVHLAIVVDEYGGVSGLVTIGDLLEEIVGEIQDEFDVGEPEVEQVSRRELLMDARVSIDQLDELWGVAVEGEGFDTMGGFVYEQLGKIPSPGDVVEYDGLKIEVVSTAGRRLKRLRVTREISDGATD